MSKDNMDLAKGGVKHDAEKARWDLFPFDVLDDVAKVLTLGANKYTDRNWETGMRWGRPLAATFRHISAWAQGEELDKESGLPHLAHALCELLFVAAYEKRKVGEDDRTKLS